MKKLPAKVEHWDDERAMGNSLIVTLKKGWRWGFSTARDDESHVRGFDTVKEARADLKTYTSPCKCERCTDRVAA